MTMSNPNTDRDERVRQIRERHQQWKQENPDRVTEWGVGAVDYLLSLLDSQAAGKSKPVGWISCGLRHGHDRIVDIVFENAECAKAFIDGVEPVAGTIVAATRMRDRCVEQLKSLHDKYESQEYAPGAMALARQYSCWNP